MGGRRVMGDAVLLPNGNVVILNGAQARLVLYAALTASCTQALCDLFTNAWRLISLG